MDADIHASKLMLMQTITATPMLDANDNAHAHAHADAVILHPHA
jgi:hypothetical protein